MKLCLEAGKLMTKGKYVMPQMKKPKKAFAYVIEERNHQSPGDKNKNL